jgi:uncharacterized protein (TIGR04255 family)
MTKDLGIEAYTFASVDKLQLIQARKHGFTFNRLKPYQHWDALIEEGKRSWLIYSELVKIARIKRVAVRFINAIETAEKITSSIQLKEYLEPSITPFSEGLQLVETLSRSAYIDSSDKITRIIGLGLAHVQNRPNPNVIIDIDLQRQFDSDPSEQQIWEVISSFRKLKNDIFFESITEKVATLLE